VGSTGPEGSGKTQKKGKGEPALRCEKKKKRTSTEGRHLDGGATQKLRPVPAFGGSLPRLLSFKKPTKNRGNGGSVTPQE